MDRQEVLNNKYNLQGANLQGVNLRGADLQGANLQGADLPDFSITPEEGSFIAWKKTTLGVIKIKIPARAKRNSCLTSRKCRAEYIKVISGKGVGGKGVTFSTISYNKNEIIYADNYNDDIRLECTNGIHFFMTRKEAEEFQ
jgi:hypothetical protein